VSGPPTLLQQQPPLMPMVAPCAGVSVAAKTAYRSCSIKAASPLPVPAPLDCAGPSVRPAGRSDPSHSGCLRMSAMIVEVAATILFVGNKYYCLNVAQVASRCSSERVSQQRAGDSIRVIPSALRPPDIGLHCLSLSLEGQICPTCLSRRPHVCCRQLHRRRQSGRLRRPAGRTWSERPPGEEVAMTQSGRRFAKGGKKQLLPSDRSVPLPFNSRGLSELAANMDGRLPLN